MRGGLGDNKEFEGVEIEARSTGSEWASLLVEGTLGRNNALKLADEKQQVPCEFPSFATLFLSRLAAHRALHSRLTCNRCRTASSGPRSGRPAQRPSPRPTLPPPRPLEAGQLGV